MARFPAALAFFVAVTTAFLANALPANAQAADPSRASTILVFDVSNSMWGQIDGVSKIEIAREVIGDLLTDWDPGVDLGLVAYGHRREGDCGDIENVIPVGPVDAAAFSRKVNALVPRGKTPLTDAVRIAADILNYRDSPATIILVSDGIESCNADPCSLAEELERGGVNFTAHVIGFDVGRIADQQQLSCLAERTGGRYLTADNASELSIALRAVAAPPPPMLRLEAATAEGGPALSDPAIRWTVVSLATEETVLGGDAMAAPALEVKPGRYFVRAELGPRVGAIEFDYDGGADLLKRVVLRVEATLDAPETVEVATPLSVGWTGPDGAGDFLALAKPGAAATDILAYARTADGSPAMMTAPDVPGAYELRYVDAAGAVLATASVEVIAPSATLDGPPVVEAGAAFKVAWTGPDVNGDYIAIVPAGAEDWAPGNYAYTRNGAPAELRAPDAEGPHELRYVSAQTRSVIARLPITVIPVAATLEASPTIGAGADIRVSWTGPDNQNDFIAIVPAGAEERTSGNYAYTRAGSPLKVRAPDDPGAYELRYLTGQDRMTLARLPITVAEVAATLEASPTIGAGADIRVAWTGPDNQNDFIAIVPAGAEEKTSGNYAYTRAGSPLKVRAPDDPGAYELRYISGQSRATIAKLPIAVAGVTASLEAPPAVSAGADVAVSWTGPDNHNDFIAIVPAGAKERTTGNYTYTRGGSPLKVLAPDEPGAYELRYISGQSRSTLASLPLAITDVTATLDAPPTANAGAEIRVAWTGPANHNDYIAIFPAGAEDGGGAQLYAYTRGGSPLDLKSFETPGAYEIRYVMSKSRRVLARLPITLTPVAASLEAPPVTPAGGTFQVIWTGPDNHNDLIAVARTDAEPKQTETYAYTRGGSPLKLKAPKEAGVYELRYLTARDKNVLARLPITVN